MTEIDLVKDAEFLEVTTEDIKFKIFTRDQEGQGLALKAWEEQAPDGQDSDWMIAGIASSTIRDHHGDTMLPSALMDMEKAANNNLTIFLNHHYQVPEDVAGSVRKATLTTRTSDAEANSGQTSDVPTTILTLAVDQTQAEKIVYGQSVGDLYLALRGKEAQVDPDSSGITAKNLFD